MLVKSFDEVHAANPLFDVRVGRRLWMVVLGYIPPVHALLVIASIVAPLMGYVPQWLLAMAPCILYLLPPLVVRSMIALRALPQGRVSVDSSDMLWWWVTAQWQVIFNRFPLLEELLRMVPAAYSMWLRLWGARVGALVYWSPGVNVLDRSCVEIGSHVVLGMHAKLHPHVIARRENDRTELILAPIRIERGAMVGGLTLLTAGSVVRAGEQVEATRVLPPFSEWRGGRRMKIQQD